MTSNQIVCAVNTQRDTEKSHRKMRMIGLKMYVLILNNIKYY